MSIKLPVRAEPVRVQSQKWGLSDGDGSPLGYVELTEPHAREIAHTLNCHAALVDAVMTARAEDTCTPDTDKILDAALALSETPTETKP